MPTMVQVYDNETGEVLTRCAADAAEIVKGQPNRFTRDAPAPKPAESKSPAPSEAAKK